MPLTPKQERFVAEYLVDLNATQAAIRAGYSPHTAQVQSARLLSKAMIREAVAGGTRAVVERVHVTAEDIVRRAWQIAQEDKGDRTAALALLAKRHQEFSEKHETTGSVRHEVVALVASMTDEQLRAAKARLLT